MRWALVIGVAVLAAGCGGTQTTADDTIRARMARVETTCAEGVNCAEDRLRPFRKCTSVSRGFRGCSTFFTIDRRTAIYRRDGRLWRKVIGPVPHEHGWWRRVLPSSDGRLLLAQWSGECEIQTTYLVSVADGKTRSMLEGLPSTAVGWALDGRARVLLPAEFWAVRSKQILRPGIYLIDPVTFAAKLERAVPARPGC